MVPRAREPKRSATSSCAGPKIRRKSLARNLPNLLAAIAVIVFTDHLQGGDVIILPKNWKAKRVQRGESLEQQGKVSAGSRADLAKTGIGLFVRKGAPKPDIHSVAAFK